MKVTISTEGTSVEIEADGAYAPDVMADLCARAIEIMQSLAEQGEA